MLVCMCMAKQRNEINGLAIASRQGHEMRMTLLSDFFLFFGISGLTEGLGWLLRHSLAQRGIGGREGFFSTCSKIRLVA